jgi:UDP-glucose 4-epimerase
VTETGRTVAVVGAASLAGTHLLELIQRERPTWEVRALDNFSTGQRDHLRGVIASDRVHPVEVDVRDRGALADALRGCDVVFQFAAILSMDFRVRLREALEVNVMGAFNALEATAAMGGRFVFSSSNATFASPEPGLVDERRPFRAQFAPPTIATYGAAKLLIESACRVAAETVDTGFTWVALRYPTVYGRRQHRRGIHALNVIDNLQRSQRRERPRFGGGRDAAHDYVHASDVARANILAAEAPSDATGRAYIIASGVTTTNTELAEILERVTRSGLEPIWEDAEEDRNRIPQQHIRFDIAAARQHLGYEPKMTVEDGIRDLYESLPDPRDGAPTSPRT